MLTQPQLQRFAHESGIKNLDIVEKEVLQTPQLGAVEAFHLRPRPLTNPRGNITAEFWFAPTLQYLPVRILVNAGDARLDLLVDKIEQR